jgi:hypothetical protein
VIIFELAGFLHLGTKTFIRDNQNFDSSEFDSTGVKLYIFIHNEVRDFDKKLDSTGNSSQPSSRQRESTVLNSWSLIHKIGNLWSLLHNTGNLWSLLHKIDNLWSLLHKIGNLWSLLHNTGNLWSLIHKIYNLWSLLSYLFCAVLVVIVW